MSVGLIEVSMQAYGSLIHKSLKLCTTVLSVNLLSPCIARLFLYKWSMRSSLLAICAL